MRQLAFQHAFSQICSHVNAKETQEIAADGSPSLAPTPRLASLPRQLGVDRSFLSDLYRHLPRSDLVRQILLEMRDLSTSTLTFAVVTKVGSASIRTLCFYLHVSSLL